MSFRKPYHIPFRKLIPPFTLTGRDKRAKSKTSRRHNHVYILGNLRWRRFRGDGDRTGRESLELRQPSLPVKNRTLRSQ